MFSAMHPIYLLKHVINLSIEERTSPPPQSRSWRGPPCPSADKDSLAASKFYRLKFLLLQVRGSKHREMHLQDYLLLASRMEVCVGSFSLATSNGVFDALVT